MFCRRERLSVRWRYDMELEEDEQAMEARERRTKGFICCA